MESNTKKILSKLPIIKRLVELDHLKTQCDILGRKWRMFSLTNKADQYKNEYDLACYCFNTRKYFWMKKLGTDRDQ